MRCLVITLLVACAFAASSALKHKPWKNNDILSVRANKYAADDESTRCIAEGSDGSEYRGTVSVTAKGHGCLRWNRFRSLGSAVTCGLGSHNYCRNPDKSIMPWCRVKRGTRIMREFCDIPRCEAKPTESPTEPTEPTEPEQDTERTCGERSLNSIYRIIGGYRTTVESQPWMASIFVNKCFKCGGTLIAPCWVLTAAHCFPSGRRNKLEHISVYLGKNAINETDHNKEQKFKVTKLIIHEDFDNTISENYNNDIALMQIVDSSGQCAQRTRTVRTVCLPPSKHMMPYGSFCTTAGYGTVKSNGFEYSKFLKEARLELISPKVCHQDNYYGKSEVPLTDNMVCAGSPTWKDDACQGDSGGPMVCEVNGRMFLFGVVSWGEQCATKFKPGVYTKVTNYNKWIEDHTGLPSSFTSGIMYPHKR
ncbi:urokinase-type plasminogen activator [Astyanax mexicanus]|uniref:trypsin n=1 Tax=Astyanax mexicanus TaxID=7994 RepID=A0A8T2LX06_ASTMX|nr:urokinase-type plasminogen activator [Astyanax mexicanus]